MADGFGTSPFILPNMFGSPGQAVENTLRRQERKEERDYDRQLRERDKQNQYRLFNIREIDQDTDFSKFRTGEERFDTYTQKELQNIKNKALAEYVSLPPEEAKYKIGKDMQDLVQWHGAVTANIGDVKEGLKELNRKFPNIDPMQAHDLAYLNLGRDYLEKDAGGNLVRRKPEIVNPKNYVAELFTPENFSQLNIYTSLFQKSIELIPKTSV